MPIDVIVLERGNPYPLYIWREEDVRDIDRTRWRQLALSLARRAAENRFLPMEVFLCPVVEQPGDLLNYRLIADVAATAREFSWAANIYVAVDDSNLFLNQLMDHLATLQLWFQEMHRVGVTDVLQVNAWSGEKRIQEGHPEAMSHLQAGADRSIMRQRGVRPNASWKCLLRKEDAVLRNLLSSFEVYSDASLPFTLRGNLITVLEDSSVVRQNRMVDRALISCRRGNHLVALPHPFSPSEHIKELRNAGRVQTLSYRGLFEVAYLVHLLNPRVETGDVRERGKEKSVTLSEPLFKPVQHTIMSSMLLTSTFDPDTDELNCLLAAREAGHCTRRKPAHTEYLVHPSVTCQNLPDLIERLGAPLTVWLHLGHGDAREGLAESQASEFRSPRRWLESFSAYGNSLALAVFSACESTSVARRFAQAGVGVTVGFEKEVPSEACEFLTAELVGAALNFNGDPKAILKAFHRGCAKLKARGFKGLGPTAFYSKR